MNSSNRCRLVIWAIGATIGIVWYFSIHPMN